MENRDRIYYARRAAEEEELAVAAADNGAAQVHRQLQRAYLERASSVRKNVAAIPCSRRRAHGRAIWLSRQPANGF